jgi:hypothetical protein
MSGIEGLESIISYPQDIQWREWALVVGTFKKLVHIQFILYPVSYPL